MLGYFQSLLRTFQRRLGHWAIDKNNWAAAPWNLLSELDASIEDISKKSAHDHT